MVDYQNRSHGNEGKHCTLVTMMKATTVPKVTMITKINNHNTSLYDPTASDASFDPTSQVSSSTILLLPIVGN
jgi:hypothetical protein